MLVGMSPEPCVAQTTSSTSCDSRSAVVAALSVTSTECPAAVRTGFSASATIWALPDSVPTRISMRAITSEISDGEPPCDATSRRWLALRRGACQSDCHMEETPVLAAFESGVLSLTLNRPERLNAMNNPLIEAMNRELARARDDDQIRAVLLTGTGRAFCAGADLAGGSPVDFAAGPPDLGADMDRIFNPMIRAMRELPKPIVGAINGVAAGGGANFALAC